MRIKSLSIGLGALLILLIAGGFAFASDSSPKEEPADSPFFDAILQQAVDELDGKAKSPSPRLPAQTGTQHYTTDPNVWPECEFGYTRDPAKWPLCHYTTDPSVWPECEQVPSWPTKDYTWDNVLWPECENVTQDPVAWYCDPLWTLDPQMGPQCDPKYTRDPELWPQCNPRYTWDTALWPWCGDPAYTTNPDAWPECEYPLTSDPNVWRECHFTSDPQNPDCYDEPYITQDYTSHPGLWPVACPPPNPEYTHEPMTWPWCNPEYTTDPRQWGECSPTGNNYTLDPAIWSWCREDPLYTTNPVVWPECHYTSDPERWPDECQNTYPTKDYTWDFNVWPECDLHTQDPAVWPWCNPEAYTTDPDLWPWCNQAWTWEPDLWPECMPGYTNDPDKWRECSEGLYTQQPATWPECQFYTADARIWPECHYTSDPRQWSECLDWQEPTKDYTTDPKLWPECDLPDDYTSDPLDWPECHYTTDPTTWPSQCQPLELGDLGDAPDSTNHAGANMTAYPPGGPPGTLANYPTIFDPAAGMPQGPKHFAPRYVWLGPWATLENDADLMPDEDGLTNINPSADTPDRDGADDGLLYPVSLPHCTRTVISYTVTVTPGAMIANYYVNIWFDWNRDGDWQDSFTCNQPMDTPEWAVQNQIVSLSPGTHILQTPAFLPFNTAPSDPLWMRISVAGGPAPANPTTDLADGRGPPAGYMVGETEDYYLQWEQEEYDIFIKDSDVDDGSVPSSSPFWVSPDIWVRNDGNCTQTDHQNPTPGTTTTVCIRTRNRMSTAVSNITVNAYWGNAALGLSWPTSWSYINSLHIPLLAGSATMVKSVQWYVPYTTGHFCLLARADATQDPIASGPDTVSPVDKAINNNNIAQKNTHIVDYPQVTGCGFYSTNVATDTIYFDAVNTYNKTIDVDISFDSSDFPIGSGTLLIEPGSLWGRWTTLSNLTPISGSELEPFAFPATMIDIQMMPYETARMTMTISAEIDERFTIQVTQYISDTEAGGIEYVRDLPVCIYLPLIKKNN